MTKIPTGERLAKLEQKVEDINQNMLTNHAVIIQELQSIKCDLKDGYVSKTEFQPVKAIAFGAAGLALAAITTAIIYLVVIT